MDWHIYPRKDSWGLRKRGSGRTIATYRRRREAISAAKAEVGKGKGVIYVHNESGMVVIRIPELHPLKVAASVSIKKAADMTPKGRKDIAAWLRRQATDLLKLGTQYASNFRGRYYYL